MFKFRNLALFLFIIFCAISSHAEQTGNDLLRGCNAIVKSADKAELSNEELIFSIFWSGYIAGHTDSYIITRIGGKATVYCYPSGGIEINQTARIVVKYLKENPKELHQSARLCLLLALKNAFPCNK